MKQKKDITIHNMKGFLFLLYVGFIGAGIMFGIMMVAISYKEHQRNKAFWNEIQANNLGYCDKLTFLTTSCTLDYNLLNETNVCNIALKHMRKELINKLDVCSFKIK